MNERNLLVEELKAINKKRSEINDQLEAIDHETNLNKVKQYLGKCYKEVYNGGCIRCLFVYSIDEKNCDLLSLLLTYYPTEANWFQIECYTLFNPERHDEDDSSKWEEITKDEFNQHYLEVQYRIKKAYNNIIENIL